MEQLSYTFVDVFAENKYSGNQLAVFKNGGALSSQEMQLIAREINFSETTFIVSGKQQDGSYDVRIFTPKEEIPFAGHPTLGTAYVIQDELEDWASEEVLLHYSIGVIPVRFQGEESLLWMRQQPPQFGHVYNTQEFLRFCNLSSHDVDTRYPIQAVSTGLPVILMPVKSLSAVQNFVLQRERFLSFIRDEEAKTLMIFCPEALEKENTLHARFFGDYFGVPEDPATGSANGCLAGYLCKYDCYGFDKVDLRVEQGFEINRPSILHLKAEKNKLGEIAIQVGGKVVKVSEGAFV